MASRRKVSFELGAEGSGGHRLTPGSLCLTSLIPSFLCKRGGIMLASSSGLLRAINSMTVLEGEKRAWGLASYHHINERFQKEFRNW